MHVFRAARLQSEIVNCSSIIVRKMILTAEIPCDKCPDIAGMGGGGGGAGMQQKFVLIIIC